MKIKLPRSRELKKHPLVVTVDYLMRRDGLSMRQVALQRFCVTQQTLQDWYASAEADRDYLIPAMRVPQVSKFASIAPYWFNPVLWPNPNWVF